jgi:hypothetical protein
LISQLQRVQEEREHDNRELQARISHLEGREKALTGQVTWAQELLKKGKGEDMATLLSDNQTLQDKILELEGNLAAKAEELATLREKVSDRALYCNQTKGAAAAATLPRSFPLDKESQAKRNLLHQAKSRSYTQLAATRTKSRSYTQLAATGTKSRSYTLV